MPFRARRDGSPVVPSLVDNGEAVTCPDCGGKMYPRSPPNRVRHFYHVSDAAGRRCSNGAGGESEDHKRAVARVEVALHQQFGDANATIGTEIDVDVTDIPTPFEVRRADSLVEFDGKNPFFGNGLAVEVQHKHKDKDEQQATHDYLAAGYSVVWIPSGTVLLDTFDYDTLDDEFKNEDGRGYAQRTSSARRFTDCESVFYDGEHNWHRVPEYAHPRGQDDLVTYDICVDKYCELRRMHALENAEAYSYTESNEHAPDFPLKALRNVVVPRSRYRSFTKWAGKQYGAAPLEKLLAIRSEVERCRGPKGIHEWGQKETLWTNHSDRPMIELRKCLYCPVRLVTNRRGYPDDYTFCFYGREPPHEWDDVYFKASPRECDHYLYDASEIEDYCPKCGATMDEETTTLSDF